MSLQERVGQLLMVAIESNREPRPLTISPAIHATLREVGPGGVILYGSSFDTVEQVHALVRDLHAASSIPLLLATDHEGGAVNRLTEKTRLAASEVPPAAAIGRTGRPELAREVGRVVGRELRALGIHACLCPVADVRSGSMLSSRAFSSEPEGVGRFAAAFVGGLQGQGVMAVVKHFPGLGGATEDTHVTVPRVGDSFAVVRDRDLAPFRRVFDAGPGGVMLGHHAVLELDRVGRPATVSPPIAHDLLREVMRFEGLVFTDALNMQAITELLSDGDLAVEALAAGADVLLVPRDPEAAVKRIVDAVRSGRLSEARINESLRRVLHAKLRLGVLRAAVPLRTEAGPAVDPGSAAEARAILGAPEHRRLIREIEAAASSTSPR